MLTPHIIFEVSIQCKGMLSDHVSDYQTSKWKQGNIFTNQVMLSYVNILMLVNTFTRILQLQFHSRECLLTIILISPRTLQ